MFVSQNMHYHGQPRLIFMTELVSEIQTASRRWYFVRHWRGEGHHGRGKR